MEHCVSQPHRGQGALYAQREIFRHSLYEPERYVAFGYPVLCARFEYLELKGVNELVTENMVVFGIEPCQWQNDATLEPFSESSRTLGDDAAGDVRLLEVGMVGLDNHRLRDLEVRTEDGYETRVPSLQHDTRIDRRTFLRRIVIDLEMTRSEHLKIEMLVVDLISAEILTLRRSREYDENNDAEAYGARPR